MVTLALLASLALFGVLTQAAPQRGNGGGWGPPDGGWGSPGGGWESQASAHSTVQTTAQPTVEPTDQPAVQPTEQPTIQPTEQPTVQPPNQPTTMSTYDEPPATTYPPEGGDGGAGGGGGPTTPDGYSQQLFLDDFSSGSLDTSIWTYDIGTSYPDGPSNWGTGEIQTYTQDPKNIKINSEGDLVITPTNDNGQWKSSRIETTASHDLGCAAGGKLMVEGKIKVGSGASILSTDAQMGIWPAFWMLGSKFRGGALWPGVGEIDILETANGDNTVHHTVHCGTAPGGTCNENTGIGSSYAFSRGEFHTLGFEIDLMSSDWAQQRMNWYVDGSETMSLTAADLSDDQAAWKTLTVNKKMILLNVAVGGGFPDGISGQTTPSSNTQGGESVDTEVAYVAVWST